MNIFQDPTKSVPTKASSETVRVDMEQLDIGGRKSHLPSGQKSSDMSITHVANSGASSNG